MNFIEEKLLEATISGFVGEIFSQSKGWIKGLSEEVKTALGISLEKYLIKQKNDYSRIKTLLRGNNPVYLYDVYYPIKLVHKNDETMERKVIDTNSITKVFQRNNCITIIGDAGSGKSTLIKHLFLNTISSKKHIPMLIELRYLNDFSEGLETYIYSKLFETKLTESSSILTRFLEDGKFVFFLDGFDELNAEVKQNVINSLVKFISQFGKNKFIITTRPYSDAEHLPMFSNYNVKSLEFETGEINDFVYKQLQSEAEVADKIVKTLDKNKNGYISSFLANPLLLSLYILTFQSNAEVPNKKYIFYRRVINALFSEHDSKTKLGFVREKLSGLNQEQFEEILKAFCFLSYFDNKFSWDSDYVNHLLKKIKQKMTGLRFDNNLFIKDLKSAVALWVEDNGIISFAHRSLQEYFAALCVKSLNPVDNQRVYEKIIEKFSIEKSNEVENFLSLCLEMDEVNFNKYYYLPLLNELRLEIDKTNDDTLVNSLLSFFLNQLEIVPEKEGPARVDINDNIYKTIYIHLPYTRDLYHFLMFCGMRSRPMMRSIGNSNTNKHEPLPPGLYQINGDCESNLSKICFEQVLPIATRFSSFLDKEIKRINGSINRSENIDRGLVDMIG